MCVPVRITSLQFCLFVCEFLTPTSKYLYAYIINYYVRLLWNLYVHHRLHKSSAVDSILSQMNPVRIYNSYFFKIHFNITITFSSIFPMWFLRFEFSYTISYVGLFLSYLMCATISYHPILDYNAVIFNA